MSRQSTHNCGSFLVSGPKVNGTWPCMLRPTEVTEVAEECSKPFHHNKVVSILAAYDFKVKYT